MIDSGAAIVRTLGFEDPQWHIYPQGGRPEPDTGGTIARFGINSRYNPSMPAGFYDGSLPYGAALSAAMKCYRENYWLPSFDGLADQAVANVCFDLMVNPGLGAGTRIVQKACNSKGQALTVDGGFGPLTVAACNAIGSSELLVTIQDERVAYYASLPGWRDPDTQAAWKQRTYAK